MKKHLLLLSIVTMFAALPAQERLTGTIITDGSASAQSSSMAAFDGDVNTLFESGLTSHAWIGYEFPVPHVIRKVRWHNAEGLYNLQFTASWFLALKTVPMPHSCLAVIEGANEPDFSDGIPIYMIQDRTANAEWHEADIQVTRGFKYVRYVGPSCSTARVAELEFYGEEGEGSDEQFYQPTNLPVVIVHTRDTETTSGVIPAGTDPVDKVNELVSYFAFVSQEGGKILEQDGTFRLRGNTSMKFDKRPYRIKFNEKQKVFASGYKAKKWTLVPSYDDKSLMRNLTGFGINARTGLEYTPYGRPVDVFVNGEFRGNYQFCDQIEANRNRIDIEEIGDTENPESAYDFGWFVEIDSGISERFNDSPYFTSSKYRVPVSYKSPDTKELTSAYKRTIKEHFEKMEASCLQGTAENYIDVNSFARYFIAVEFICNSDGYHSVNLHKHLGDDRFYFGPVWDLNLSLDNDSRTYPVNNRTEWSYVGSWADAGNIRQLMYDLFENNPVFMEEVHDIWANLRQTGAFNTDSILADHDVLVARLDSSLRLNFLRWDMLDRKIFYEPSLPKTWPGEVERLRHALEGRVDWMDSMLGTSEDSYELEVTSAGWATVYLPFAFDVPKSLRCFEVSGVEGETLVLNDVTVTEANKPYLVRGQQGTYVLSGYSSQPRDQRQKGMLTGTSVGCHAPVDAYVLQNHDGQVAFYHVSEGLSVNVPSTKAYLTLPSLELAAPTRTLFLDDAASGLEFVNMDSSVADVKVFDLAGHLVRIVPSSSWDKTRSLRDLAPGSYVVVDGTNGSKLIVH